MLHVYMHVPICVYMYTYVTMVIMYLGNVKKLANSIKTDDAAISKRKNEEKNIMIHMCKAS